jgi:hypothetical protein
MKNPRNDVAGGFDTFESLVDHAVSEEMENLQHRSDAMRSAKVSTREEYSQEDLLSIIKCGRPCFPGPTA